MEHIPARHAAKLGMRYPAQVAALRPSALVLELDLTAVAPGRSPHLAAFLLWNRTVAPQLVRSFIVGQRFEVVLIEIYHDTDDLCVSLPADPAWLAWNGGTVRQLARQIRATGDTSALPVLADALEEAGCDERELLARCRRPEDDDLTWLVTLLATQE